MIWRVVSAELAKLRRPTFTIGLVIAAALMTAIATTLAITSVDGEVSAGPPGTETLTIADFAGADGLVAGFAQGAQLLGLLALGVAAWSFAGEFSQGTLRNVLVRQPSRTRFVVGKWIALGIYLCGIAAVAWAFSIVLSFALAPGQGVDTGAWVTAEGLGDALGGYALMVAALIGYATLGAVLGLLLRSPVAAVSVGAIYLLPFEGLLSGSWDDADRWLPGQLLSSVASDGTEAIAAGAAAWRFWLFALVAGAIAAWSFRRRDVSA